MTTPDRFPGSRLEDEIVLEENPGPSSGPGSILYDGTNFQLQDSAGAYNPRSGSSLLGKAVFKSDGGIVYDTGGNPLLKVNG